MEVVDDFVDDNDTGAENSLYIEELLLTGATNDELPWKTELVEFLMSATLGYAGFAVADDGAGVSLGPSDVEIVEPGEDEACPLPLGVDPGRATLD